MLVLLLLLIVCCYDVSTALECPNGFSAYDSSCYLYVGDVYTWFEAQVACWSMRARLVEIETEEENRFIGSLVQSRGGQYAWTGMIDLAKEGTFMLPSTHREITYSNWRAGEPNDNNVGPGEVCVFIAADATWLDAQCHDYREPFICEISFGKSMFPSVE